MEETKVEEVVPEVMPETVAEPVEVKTVEAVATGSEDAVSESTDNGQA